MDRALDYPIRSKRGEPPWEMATLYPPQGGWTLGGYLELTTNRLIEFNEGCLEFLAMPTEDHQRIVAVLYRLLFAFVEPRRLGTLFFAPLRVQTLEEKVREPDIVFMTKEHDSRRGKRLWKGADLVVEVVSEGLEDRERDYVEKREEYREAGILEYWIVDPQERRITVLKLVDGAYAEHCMASAGGRATSALLDGFSVDLHDLFE